MVRAMVRVTVRVRFRGVTDRVGKNVLPPPIIIHNSQKMNSIIVPYFDCKNNPKVGNNLGTDYATYIQS